MLSHSRVDAAPSGFFTTGQQPQPQFLAFFAIPVHLLTGHLCIDWSAGQQAQQQFPPAAPADIQRYQSTFMQLDADKDNAVSVGSYPSQWACVYHVQPKLDVRRLMR